MESAPASSARLLEDAGFRVACQAFAPGRTSLVARLGAEAARPAICFTGRGAPRAAARGHR
jgi:hypothetical protein